MVGLSMAIVRFGKIENTPVTVNVTSDVSIVIAIGNVDAWWRGCEYLQSLAKSRIELRMYSNGERVDFSASSHINSRKC